MKMNKFLMLGIAGLAFAACSNEEDAINNGNPTLSGNGVVAVRIVKPAVTKAMTEGATVAIDGNITVTLTGKKADNTNYSETIVIAADQVSESTPLKFWNIAVPDKLTATINSGTNDYSTTSITTLWQTAPANAPAYGETSTFTRIDDEKGTPDLSKDNNGTNNGTEAGANTGDDQKEYDMFTATVQMAIPMARLEVGDITFEAPTPGPSIYSSIIFTGCYLNGYADKGGAYSNSKFAAVAPGSFNMEFETGTSLSSLKYDAEDNHEFTTTPINDGEGECYAFNFYAGTTNPRFTLYFKTGTVTDQSRKFPRYAYISNYYTDGTQNPIQLENGHIYQITGVKLSDKNIVGDPDNALYGVDVTVKEATWTVTSIDAGWAEQK